MTQSHTYGDTIAVSGSPFLCAADASLELSPIELQGRFLVKSKIAKAGGQAEEDEGTEDDTQVNLTLSP